MTIILLKYYFYMAQTYKDNMERKILFFISDYMYHKSAAFYKDKEDKF